MKINTLICLTFLFSATLAHISVAKETPRHPNDAKQLLAKDIGVLNKLQENKDFTGFETAATKMKAKWAKNPDYPSFMKKVVDMLSSKSFGFKDDTNRLALAKTYADEILQQPLPLPLRMSFVEVFANQNESLTQDLTQDQWIIVRQRRVTHWLSVWQEVSEVMSVDLSASEPVWLNVPVPDDSAPAGIEPSAVKDPQVRAAYVKAIEENRRKAEARTFHHQIRNRERSYSRTAEWYIVKAYSELPFNLPELKQLLDKYEIGEEREKRILDAVIAQMKYAVEGATSLQSTPPPLPSIVPTPEPTPQATPSPTPAPKQ